MSQRLTTTFNFQNANQDALTAALQHHTRSHACSSAKSAVLHAYAFLLELMATSKHALVIIAGRPKKEGQNALEFLFTYKSNKQEIRNYSLMSMFFVMAAFSYGVKPSLMRDICGCSTNA